MKSKPGTPAFTLFLFSILFYTGVFSQNLATTHSFRLNLEARLFPASKNFQLTSSPFLFADTARKKDRDGDGVVDSLDKCPDEKGSIQYDGCPIPDSDNDGIADDSDACPTIPGLAKYRGCPPSDRDGDKINDEDDNCPDVPGVARYDGCPVGDRDRDGVNDDDDKCIDVAGPAVNSGCPEAKRIHKSSSRPRKKK